jgi:hypothetical protein
MTYIFIMSSEFDWFMVTMPIFAIVVYLIVMVSAMEKQPKFLEGSKINKNIAYGIVTLFVVGSVYSFCFMILRFIELLGNY